MTPTVDNQPVTIAYVEHPSYLLPLRELIAVFKNGPQYHILSGSLDYANSPEGFQYLHDSVLGLLEGMSFDS